MTITTTTCRSTAMTITSASTTSDERMTVATTIIQSPMRIGTSVLIAVSPVIKSFC